jgi:hypothetical protein
MPHADFSANEDFPLPKIFLARKNALDCGLKRPGSEKSETFSGYTKSPNHLRIKLLGI